MGIKNEFGLEKKQYAYLNNPRLKRANVDLPYTKEQIKEYRKCSKNIIYFAEKYVKIIDVDKGKILIKLFSYQKKELRALQKNRFVALLQARQSGKSTVVTIFLLWFVLFHSDKNCCLLAHKGKMAIELLSRIRMAYMEMPLFLQQGVVEWNKGNIELENGSKVMAAATSSESVTGEAFSFVFCDEVAKIPTNVWQVFYESTYPTISSGKKTRFVMASTPKGLNQWYKICEDARQKKNLFKLIEVDWKKVPGRNAKWKKDQIANMGEDSFEQEHCLGFLGSSLSLISTATLKTLTSLEPLHHKENLRIYKKPEEGHVYMVTVDVSRGKELDYSAFSVIDITESPYEQVATFRSNVVSTLLYPTIIFNTATYYNSAFVMVEINNNGEEVANILNYDLEYENLLSFKRTKKGKSYDLGLYVTNATRVLGCSTVKDLVENQHLMLHDENTILELSGFIAKGGKYQADVGFNDDLVMGLVNFSWFTRQTLFKDLMDQDVRKAMFEERMKEIEESMLPDFHIDDGLGAGIDGEEEEFVHDGVHWRQTAQDDGWG